MKLYPKARPVRIKLIVGEEEHSSLDSLRDNFDVEEVIKLYDHGGLKNWLQQINEEEIWDKLNEVGDVPELKMYEETYNIFFPEETLPLESRLLYLQDKYYSSFKKLLNSLLNNPEFVLSVEKAKVFFRTAIEMHDAEVTEILRSRIYSISEKNLKKMNDLYQTASEKDNVQLHDLMKQMATEWNVEKQSSVDSSFDEIKADLEGLVNAINSSEIFNLSSLQIQLSNLFLSRDYTNQLNTSEKKALIDQISDAKKYLNRILDADLEVNNNNYEYNLRIKICGGFIVFPASSWYAISEIIDRNLNEDNKFALLINWKWAILKIFIICFFLKGNNNQLKYYIVNKFTNQIIWDGYRDNNIIVHFFKSYGNDKHFPSELSKIRKLIGGNNLKTSKGLTRFIYQSLLFVAVLGLYRDENSLSDLIESGYRPAKLLAGLVPPVTKLEKLFLELNDVGKIQLLIENNFTLSHDGNRD